MIDLWWNYFIWFFVIIGIIILLVVSLLLLWSIYSHKERHSFRFRARKILADTRRLKGIRKLFFLSGIRINSEGQQSIIITLLGISAFIVAFWKGLPLSLDSKSWFQIYILILTATIPAVAILSTFIVRKEEESELARAVHVIFRITGVRVIITGQLVALLILGFIHLTYPSVWTDNSTGLLSCWAMLLSLWLFIQTFRVIADPKRIHLIALDIEKMKPGIVLEEELLRRVSNNLILKLCEELRITSPFDFWRPENDFLAINHFQSGTIVDLDPQRLRNLARDVERKLPKDSAIETTEPVHSLVAEPRLTTKPSPRPIMLLDVLIGDKVDKRTPVMSIPKNLVKSKLKRMIRVVFKIGKGSSKADDFEANLRRRAERFVQHLRLKEYEKAGEISNEFLAIFNALLKESTSYSATYSDLLDLPWRGIVVDFESIISHLLIDATKVVTKDRTGKARKVLFDLLRNLSSIPIDERLPSWLYVMMRQFHFIYQTVHEEKNEEEDTREN